MSPENQPFIPRQDAEAVTGDMQAVVDFQRKAIMDLIKLTTDETLALYEDFWSTYITILERESVNDPDIAQKVLERAQAIQEERHQAERTQAGLGA